jgi:hypothetical protein
MYQPAHRERVDMPIEDNPSCNEEKYSRRLAGSALDTTHELDRAGSGLFGSHPGCRR